MKLHSFQPEALCFTPQSYYCLLYIAVEKGLLPRDDLKELKTQWCCLEKWLLPHFLRQELESIGATGSRHSLGW